MIFEFLVRKLQDWTFSIRLRCGQKIMYNENRKIVKVWPNLLIKGPCSQQELEAMEFAQTIESVHSPRVHRVYHRKDGIFIAMEFIKGTQMDHIWPKLTVIERKHIVKQLWTQIEQLHALTPPASLGHVVAAASISGEPGTDGSLEYGIASPYTDIEEFRTMLDNNRMLGNLSRLWAEDRGDLGRTSFVHGDLVPRNIIQGVDGRLVLIDWEFAGWWPTYWEQVKWYFSDFPRLDGWVELMDEMLAERK